MEIRIIAMLEEKTEIITYPGQTGNAAQSENLMAMISNKKGYDIPLDFYNQIDGAVVGSFESIGTKGDARRREQI